MATPRKSEHLPTSTLLGLDGPPDLPWSMYTVIQLTQVPRQPPPRPLCPRVPPCIQPLHVFVPPLQPITNFQLQISRHIPITPTLSPPKIFAIYTTLTPESPTQLIPLPTLHDTSTPPHPKDYTESILSLAQPDSPIRPNPPYPPNKPIDPSSSLANLQTHQPNPPSLNKSLHNRIQPTKRHRDSSPTGFKKSKLTSGDDVHHAFAQLHIVPPAHTLEHQPEHPGETNIVILEECISSVRRRFIHIKRQAREVGRRQHSSTVIEELPAEETCLPTAELAREAGLNMPPTTP